MGADEVAVELGLDPSTVRRLAREGQLPHYRWGQSVRFDLDELLAAGRRDVVDTEPGMVVRRQPQRRRTVTSGVDLSESIDEMRRNIFG